MKNKVDLLYESFIDVGIIVIFGMYLIFSQMASKNFWLLGIMASINVFFFSYLMRRFIMNRNHLDLVLALILFVFPMFYVGYILLSFS